MEVKNKLTSSFRFEIILYSLLSLIFTILTELVLGAGAYLIVKLVNPSFVDNMLIGVDSDSIQERINDNLANSPKDPVLPRDNNYPDNVFGSGYDEYRFKENINISIRLNRELLITLIIIAVALGLVLFIVYFLALTRKFSKYLNNITYGIGEISNGNFKHHTPVESTNEFGLISQSLNEMAYKLDQINLENEKNEKNKNAIITSLAHDLRTPLTSITGYLELLVNNKDMPEETRQDYLNIAYKKSKALEDLIEDLFDYTRVSLGEMNVKYTTINMVQFINQLVDEFYPSFKENDLDYEVNIEGNPIYVEGDGDLLARAISNLISNAIKYGKDGKMVNINLKKEDDKVVLQIINYGQIIPEESMSHIFERFYRVEGSRSSETGGTGLGLSIAKEIIELHGGSISAKSNLSGTVFEVVLEAKALGVSTE